MNANMTKNMTRMFTAAAVLLIAAKAFAAFEVVYDVPYNPAIGTAGLGNLYLPANYGPDTPVALAIHGGSWSGGDRASWAGVAEFLCNDLGFVVFNIEYRLTGVGPWPLCGNDCIDAANYLLSAAFEQQYGIACKKVWPCGGSAGGHLALWTGLSLAPDKVAGIISISGIGDLQPDAAVNPSRYVSLFGYTPTTQELIDASPMSLVGAGAPPVFCSHAAVDTVVPPESTQNFVDACRAAGVTVDHYVYEARDDGHSIWIADSNPHKLFSDIESAIAKFVWTQGAAGLAVGRDDFYTEVEVTNEVAVARPLIAQDTRKLGSGRLKLINPRVNLGEMEIINGSVEVQMSDTFAQPELPAALRSKAAFWVDANTNVVADENGKVVRWHDVREQSVSGPAYTYMMATNDVAERQPTVEVDAGLGNKKYLDFGVWGHQDTNENSRWLFWASPNGLVQELTVRAVFVVFGTHNSSGGGCCTLIQHTVHPHFASWLNYLWASTVNTYADKGVNYFDRESRNGRTIALPDSSYHMIENLPVGSALKANTFGKDRIYPGYSGGSRICEALVFSSELTDTERLQVQDYLWHKWFERGGEEQVGSFTLRNEAELDFVTGTNVVRANVIGDGKITKTGIGRLALMNFGSGTFDGTVTLREGNLLVTGEPFLFEIEEGGQTLHAQDMDVIRTAGTAGRVAKTGTGELAVSSVDESVTGIDVADGILRLATPRAAVATSAQAGTVNEWSLEAFTNGEARTTSWINYTPGSPATATVNGWRFDRSEYSSGGLLLGVAFDFPEIASVSRVLGANLAPDGDTVLYINRGLVETDFTVPVSGYYRLSFYAAARSGSLNRHVEVKIDGVTIRTIITLSTQFWRHEIMLPHLAAGAHTLGVNGIGATLTEFRRVSFIDAIRITPVCLCEDAPATVAVTNPSFEEPPVLFEINVVTNEPPG
ncbi:MAG: alpha/beta hydrolase fold domain-containing protein, partial [Kiritimatiellae bacterium]|nr:alpha/beta hydrolase fold domain-containing protein [Kiritimatiellia bacterium]